MKKLIRMVAAGLVGAHVTGALAWIAVEDYDQTVRLETAPQRVIFYILSPYIFAYAGVVSVADAVFGNENPQTT